MNAKADASTKPPTQSEGYYAKAERSTLNNRIIWALITIGATWTAQVAQSVNAADQLVELKDRPARRVPGQFI